jgi:acetyl-CoA decarbonylase/synthase complex subunit gamma
VCEGCIDGKLPLIEKVDYDRLGERMYVEFLNAVFTGDIDKYKGLVEKSAKTGRGIILEVTDLDAATAAIAIAGDRVILNGANASNFEAFSALATQYKAVLGVSGKNLDELYDTVTAIEKLGNKNLILDVTGATVKETFANAVQIRRAALKDNDRTFGYPSLVNLHNIAQGDTNMQTALASLFTLKYGSIIVLDKVEDSQALPLYGLRQNIYTDPQKPMKVEPGIYPLNGADENATCVTTVDFALTYFVVSGELERSGVPLNLLISDAGGYSVLTAWAAGKLSAGSIARFFKEFEIEGKLKSRTLVIPGKVAVLKGEIEEKLPGWSVVVAPNEAVELVKFFKEFKRA